MAATDPAKDLKDTADTLKDIQKILEKLLNPTTKNAMHGKPTHGGASPMHQAFPWLQGKAFVPPPKQQQGQQAPQIPTSMGGAPTTGTPKKGRRKRPRYRPPPAAKKTMQGLNSFIAGYKGTKLPRRGGFGKVGGLRGGGGKALGSLGANTGNAIRGGGQAIKATTQNPTNAFQGIGGLIGAAGTAGAAIPGIGPAIKGLALVGETALKSVDALRTWGNTLQQSNHHFAEFSGAMAGVQARQQVRDFYYGQERGNTRAESAEELNQSLDQLRRALAPIEDFWNKLQNSIVSDIARGVKKLVQIWERKSDQQVASEEREAERLAAKGTPYWAAINEISKNYGRPGHLNAPPNINPYAPGEHS